MNINNINNISAELMDILNIENEIEKIITIFCAGSLYEGYGNKKSDVDLFIITEQSNKDVHLTSNTIELNNLYKNDTLLINTKYKNMNFDIEVHEYSKIINYINDINDLKASTSHKLFDIIHRMKFAQPIFKIENFKKIYNSIEYEKYDLLYPLLYSTYYPMKVIDIQGAFESKDYTTSLHMSLLLYRDTIRAYLNTYGKTNPGIKWFQKNLETSPINEREKLIDINNEVWANINYSDDISCKNKTIYILNLCHSYNSKIQSKIKEVGGKNLYV